MPPPPPRLRSLPRRSRPRAHGCPQWTGDGSCCVTVLRGAGRMDSFPPGPGRSAPGGGAGAPTRDPRGGTVLGLLAFSCRVGAQGRAGPAQRCEGCGDGWELARRVWPWPHGAKRLASERRPAWGRRSPSETGEGKPDRLADRLSSVVFQKHWSVLVTCTPNVLQTEPDPEQTTGPGHGSVRQGWTHSSVLPT